MSDSATPEPSEAETSRLPFAALIGLVIGPMLVMVDSGVVNVAIPHIAKDLGAHLDLVQWTVSGYLLAIGTGLALTSYAAKRFGVRAVYLAGLAGFILGSAGCAFAPDIYWLIGLRVVQGLAGAPLVPLAMTMFLGGSEGAGPRKLSPAVGIVLFLAPAIGPGIGGTLVAASGWPLVFLVNIPLGLIGLACFRAVPRALTPGPHKDVRFDPFGFSLMALGTGSVLYATGRIATDGWSSSQVWPFALGGLVLLGLYGWWARRSSHPVVGLDLLRRRQPTLALLLATLASIVAFAAIFLVPFMAQNVQHHDALTTGLALLPQGLVVGVGTALSGGLAQRFGTRPLVIGGFLIMALSTASLWLVGVTTPLWVTALILCGRGLTVGLVIQPLLQALLQSVPRNELPDANTLFAIVERIGGSIGVSALASYYASQAVAYDDLTGFHRSVLILAAISAAAALITTRLSLSSSASAAESDVIAASAGIETQSTAQP